MQPSARSFPVPPFSLSDVFGAAHVVLSVMVLLVEVDQVHAGHSVQWRQGTVGEGIRARRAPGLLHYLVRLFRRVLISEPWHAVPPFSRADLRSAEPPT